MNMNKDYTEEHWISLILRVAMASLFFLAALGKFMMGLDVTSNNIVGMFKDSFLPTGLLVAYTRVLPFAEALIPVWLLTGYKLRAGWIYTACVLITLAFGLGVAKQNAADIYIFILTACVGIYVSRFDTCQLGGKK